MYQPWIFAATIAAGSGLFAYAVGQRDLQVPDIAPSPEAVHVIPIPVPAAIVEPASTVVELAPVVIEGRRHVRAAAPAAKPPDAARPCSNWRELGPSHVSQGQPSGSVSVRELCP